MKPTDQRNFGFGLPLTYYSTLLLPKTTADTHTLHIKAYLLPLIDYKISQHPNWEPLPKVWNTFQTHGQWHKKSFSNND